ncbi:MAG: hypothetical protein HQ485_07055 [Acidobacteria bacterium]|jgi:hypothetical protein|nr:hypothetical protein [Acidobacteriota bacterium]
MVGSPQFAFIEVHISRGRLTLIKEIELFQTLEEGQAFVARTAAEYESTTTSGWGAVDFRLVHIDGDDFKVLEGERRLVHLGIESDPQIIRKPRT